jgi:hypothetical protein
MLESDLRLVAEDMGSGQRLMGLQQLRSLQLRPVEVLVLEQQIHQHY